MSTDEYVPSDEDVYGVWTNYQCFGADDGYGPRGLERAAAEMDRYLARVRRDAAREALDRIITDVTATADEIAEHPEAEDYRFVVEVCKDFRRAYYPEETP